MVDAPSDADKVRENPHLNAHDTRSLFTDPPTTTCQAWETSESHSSQRSTAEWADEWRGAEYFSAGRSTRTIRHIKYL